MSNEALLLLFLLFGTLIVIHILTAPRIRRRTTMPKHKTKEEDLSRKLAELYKKAYSQGLRKRENNTNEDKTDR